MAVVLETTLGDLTIDLYINQRPKACLNFLKLCKIKYYNFNLFHTVNQNFIAQTGDPTGNRTGGESIWGVMGGLEKRYFEAENAPRIKHTNTGLISFVGDKDCMIASQFFITLADDLSYLDAQHCVFGEVTEGLEVLRSLNEAICDTDHRPYQDIRITHTVVLEDPFPDPQELCISDGSPEPTAERLHGGRIAPDEDIDETEGKSTQQVLEIIAEKEAKARATILEMIGDIPDAEMAPPENVLFVCKLNPVTNDDDLEIIFSRFGKIKSCEVIRDKKTEDSLQYAFVEFDERKSCEDAYFKMDNVLIDDRRIHVDFSQSVAKVKWNGKGRGVTHFNDRGEQEKNGPKNNDVGNGRYRIKKENSWDNRYEDRKDRSKNKKDYNRTRHWEQTAGDTYNKHSYKQDKRSYNYNKPDNYRSRNDDYYSRETRESKEARESKNARESRDAREFRDSRETRESKEQRNQNYNRSRNYNYKTEKYDDRNDRKTNDFKLTERRQKYDENDSDDERAIEKRTKNKCKETAKKRDSSEEEVAVKRSKKSKKKKSKRKKNDESDDSNSESDDKKLRKKKKKKEAKKSKKQESSDDNNSSDSDLPPKKSRKR